MRALVPPSEIRRLAAPLAQILDGAWQRMHWWVGVMAVAYAFSGITIVRPEEVAVILRWGRLVGDTTAIAVHGAGLMFAFPRPVDQVVRVPTRRISQVAIQTLAATPQEFDEDEGGTTNTLNPLTQGYALTGDQNIVHLEMMARYRIRDPAEWAFYGPDSEEILRMEVTSAMLRTLGEMEVDNVLSDGREELIAAATRRAQDGLDAARSGLELTSINLVGLTPPEELMAAFSSVQSEFITAETNKQYARAYAESAVPEAIAQTETLLQAARATAEADLARARGEAIAFRALAVEHRSNPEVVRERLYRDALDRVLSVGRVRWLPPPIDGHYQGMRITIGGGSSPSFFPEP
jgi:membrane protease subunit HflK